MSRPLVLRASGQRRRDQRSMGPQLQASEQDARRGVRRQSIAAADEQFSAQANADEASAIISRMDEIGRDQWVAGFAGDASGS